MLQANHAPGTLAVLAIAPAAGRILRLLDQAGVAYTSFDHVDHLKRLPPSPTLLVLDERTGPFPSLSPHTAGTVAVVDGLTQGGEEALVRAGVNEVLALDEVTPAALQRAFNRARVRHALTTDTQRTITTVHRMLDRLPLALILTRADGRIIHENARARALLDGGDALVRTRDGHLTAVSGDDARRLQAAIHAVSHGKDGPEGAVAVRPAEGGAPYSVVIVPAGPGHPGAALFIAHSESALTISTDRLSALYGLTRAEALVVASLSRGQSLEDIAAERGQQLTTLRSQLKAVFRKTGTRRQSDVIKMVLSGPAVIGSDPAPAD